MALALTLEATYIEIEARIHAHSMQSGVVHEATGKAFDEANHI